MNLNKSTGILGEETAVTHLKGLGFRIQKRNYRFKRSEIDIIAHKDNILIFIEVKFRSDTKFGQPEEFVSNNQQKKIIEAAENYISEITWTGNIRFDIIAVNAELKVEHFEDAFY